jgi:hypothetical protein
VFSSICRRQHIRAISAQPLRTDHKGVITGLDNTNVHSSQTLLGHGRSFNMAEALGVAAGVFGVVSLSIQLAESVQKVKGFYANVKKTKRLYV